MWSFQIGGEKYVQKAEVGTVLRLLESIFICKSHSLISFNIPNERNSTNILVFKIVFVIYNWHLHFIFQWTVIRRTSVPSRISCTIIMTGIRSTGSSPCMSTKEATVWGYATTRGCPLSTMKDTLSPMPPATKWRPAVAFTRQWPASWSTSRPDGKRFRAHPQLDLKGF